MLRFILLLALSSGLAGCALRSGPNAPWRADVAACQSQAAGMVGADTQQKRLALTDTCMAAKGWRATPACIETQFQGTAFCEYVR